MPSESNFDYAAVSQEGGCQLNHLYSGVIHPWGVPTQPKINPEACILPRPRARRRAVSLASRYTATAVYSRAYSFFVVYTGIQRTLFVTRRLQRSTALQRSTVYSSTAVYSLQQSTFPLRSVGGVVGLYSLTSVHGSNLGVNNVSTAHLSLDISLPADP